MALQTQTTSILDIGRRAIFPKSLISTFNFSLTFYFQSFHHPIISNSVLMISILNGSAVCMILFENAKYEWMPRSRVTSWLGGKNQRSRTNRGNGNSACGRWWCSLHQLFFQNVLPLKTLCVYGNLLLKDDTPPFSWNGSHLKCCFSNTMCIICMVFTQNQTTN